MTKEQRLIALRMHQALSSTQDGIVQEVACDSPDPLVGWHADLCVQRMEALARRWREVTK